MKINAIEVSHTPEGVGTIGTVFKPESQEDKDLIDFLLEEQDLVLRMLRDKLHQRKVLEKLTQQESK